MSPREAPSRALYPRLNGGRGGPGAKAVARNQRGRLMGAMIEAVWRHGYTATTVAELVTLAGVSKSTFYQHFESKEECFLATFDAGADALHERMEAARSTGSSTSRQLEAALTVLAEGAIEQPKVAKLMTVESFAPGAAAVPHRNRFLGFLEEAVTEALGEPPAGEGGPDPLRRAIAGGLCQAAYACMRDGRPEDLRDAREEFLDWALSFRDAELPPPPPALDTLEKEREGEPDSRRARIGRAAVEIAAERGYAALTIPLISARASISNQTFYEYFASKEAAFLEGFDALAADVRAATTTAFEATDDWAEGIGAATRTLLERIATDELLAAVAMFELPTLGTEILTSRGLIRNSLGVLIEAAGDDRPRRLSPLLHEAVVGGIATVIQLELAARRADSLPKLAPRLAQVATAPFGSRVELPA